MSHRVHIGFDWKDRNAYRVALESLSHHASIPLTVTPLVDQWLRRRGLYWRAYHVDEQGQYWDAKDGKPFSTLFSFTRFAVPLLEDFEDRWVAYMDADVMFRADIAELFALADPSKAVMVVKHDHKPDDRFKMDGVRQTTYARKNWSSVMLMNPAKCRALTKFVVNNWSGSDLHGFRWIEDEYIGELPLEWNWLEGWSDPDCDPKLVHFTNGTPDMEGHEDVAFAREWQRVLHGSAAPSLVGAV